MSTSQASERYVLFLDLLGFSDAVDDWENNGKKVALIELVRWISTAASPYTASVSADGTSLTLTVVPSITTFSDCVVVSFPSLPPDAPQDYRSVVLDIWKPEILNHMATLVGRIAARALRLELGLRGGISRGLLVHDSDYLIGPALNAAYRLESKVADMPRIVVSEDIFASSPNLVGTLLNKDDDGVPYLDYLPFLVTEVSTLYGEQASSWHEGRRQDIDSIIRNARDPKIARKWLWFRKYFLEGTFSL